MTCSLFHYATCFCIKAPGKDIDFVPLGAVYVDALATRTLFWLGHGWSGNGMLWNMNVIIVWAFLVMGTLEHEHHYGLGMDALVAGRS